MTVAERTLTDGHLKMLQASAISEEVAFARGYWTASKRSELRDLGFATVQQLVPALIVPVRSVTGEIVNYQARPNTPRIDPDRGREIKYETVAGSSVRLDVPPSCRPLIGSPTAALWVTEGAKKADALATAGVTAVALLGVDCFKTDDWDRVALDGRRVYVAFDSDVMVNPSVHSALDRIRKYLAAKGATIQFVYLPTTVGKLGVDDYLTNGGTVESLYALAEDELRDPPEEEKPKRAEALPTGYLLDRVQGAMFCRFVRFPTMHESVALALFVLHTHATKPLRRPRRTCSSSARRSAVGRHGGPSRSPKLVVRESRPRREHLRRRRVPGDREMGPVAARGRDRCCVPIQVRAGRGAPVGLERREPPR